MWIPDEVARLIEAAGNLKPRTILMTLYCTGMRRAELVRLRVEDMDSERMVIHIHKGGKDRDVALWLAAREREVLPTAYFPVVFSVLRSQAVDQASWALHLRRWVVYAKAPFGRPMQVLRYLGRYTYCVAISNHRPRRFRWRARQLSVGRAMRTAAHKKS